MPMLQGKQRDYVSDGTSSFVQMTEGVYKRELLRFDTFIFRLCFGDFIDSQQRLAKRKPLDFFRILKQRVPTYF